MTTAIQGAAAADVPASVAQQKAQLQKLVAQHAQRVGQGATSDALSALGKTIKADAKSLGVNVTLPAAQSAAAQPARAAAPPGVAAAARDIHG